MRLGFDLDGTVADMHSALAREARDLFPEIDPTSLPSSATPDGPQTGGSDADAKAKDAPAPSVGLSLRQQRTLWQFVCSLHNFWETLNEIEPGALARLASVARTRKWELIFLTSRPETAGDSAQLQSHRWLVGHGVPAPSVFVVHGSRGKIASALQLDVIVDDRPENCLDVAIDSAARPILVWRGEDIVPASARQLGIGIVKSIAECLDILEQLDEEGPEQAGMVERLKRLLGLKPRVPRLRHPDGSATPVGAQSASAR